MRNYLVTGLLLPLFLLAGCSGEDDGAYPGIRALKEAVDEFEVADMAVMIGDKNGVIYSYEKGDFTIDTQIRIASANKWLTGASIWRLIELGILNRDDMPQNYIDFWTSDVQDDRSQITLDSLLGLRSGFNNSPLRKECIGDENVSLYDCVRSLYEGGVDSVPDEEFWYGPEHFQIAALVASASLGYQDFQTIMRDYVFNPVGMSSATQYPMLDNNNARYSGGLLSTAKDYSLFLQALLAGELITDLDGFLEDRTAEVSSFSVPRAIDANGLDWHYAFGFWKECDEPVYNMECENAPIVSSPGAFGFTPWIDFNNGYWGIIAFEGKEGDRRFRSSEESIALEQKLQTIIETMLNASTAR